MLDRDAFFQAAPAVKTEDVDLPGDRGTIRVRMMTAGERDRLEVECQGKGKADVRARMVVASAINESGKPLFTYDDVPRLSGMPAYFLEPIVNAVMRINAISESDIEAIEGN